MAGINADIARDAIKVLKCIKVLAPVILRRVGVATPDPMWISLELDSRKKAIGTAWFSYRDFPDLLHKSMLTIYNLPRVNKAF
jgi:hypothetical protein